MKINADPTSAKIAADYEVYRKIYGTGPGKKELLNVLDAREPGKWGDPPSRKDAKSYQGFTAYAFGKDPKDSRQLPVPNRLGGQLPEKKPDPPPKPTKVTNVKVQPDGTIVHTDSKTGAEIPEAHDYMQAIYDDILYDTRDKLEEINKALEAYVSAPSPATAQAQAYTEKVAAFNKFVAELKGEITPKSAYADAFKLVNVDPVVTNEGFIVSARVELEWKNPSHSSSTVKVP